MATIERLIVRNFATLRNIDLKLSDLMVLVGQNDAGKTNVLRALNFLSALSKQDVQTAVARLGGIRTLCWAGNYQEGLQITVHGKLPSIKKTPSYQYDVALYQKDLSGKVIFGQESLQIEGHTSATREAEMVKVGSWKTPDLDSGLLYHANQKSSLSAESSEAQNIQSWLRSDVVQAIAGALGRLEIYKLNPDSIAKPAAIRVDPRMDFDGTGFPTLLESFSSNPERQDAFDDIIENLRRLVPSFHRVGVVTTQHAQHLLKELQFQVRVGEERMLIGGNQVSDGLLLLLGVLVLSRSNTPLVMLEEPENGIHVRALKELVSMLRELTKTGQLRLLMTTHSPYLLDHLSPEEVCIVTRNDSGDSRLTTMSEFPELPKWRRGFSLGEIWTNLGEEKMARLDG